MLYLRNFNTFSLAVAVSFFLNFTFSNLSYAQEGKTEADATFILRGYTRTQEGRSTEGVTLELKKDGKTIEKLETTRNGKYYLEMKISILNAKSEYVLYITKPKTVPKSISINTYISADEFANNTFPRYLFDLEIKMIETTETDIVLQRPSGRIHWDKEQHAFAFDQSYAKIIQKEVDNTEQVMADKKRKEEEELARLKAEEEARLKAEAEAKLLAEKKAKEEADKVLQKNLEAMKNEMKKKRMQDSLDSLAAVANNATVVIKKFVKPISPEDVDQNAFDGTSAYSINFAKRSIKRQQEKMNRKKAANLATKYETNNTLTSLLNMVDEYDKNQKSIAKRTK